MRERGGNPAQAHPRVPVPPLRTPDRRLIGLTINSPCSAVQCGRSARQPNGLSMTISGYSIRPGQGGPTPLLKTTPHRHYTGRSRIFHVNAPGHFVRDKRLEPREPPRFYFVGLFIQTSTKLPSPSSLNRTPFIVPSAWTCARATPPREIQKSSVRSGGGESPPGRVKLLSFGS